MKPFAWSWSKLKNYRTCPKRHYEVDVAKNYSDDGSEAIIWGKQVHDALASRVGKGTPLPVTMQGYEDWPASIDKMRAGGAKVLVENKLAMGKGFLATGFFAADTWFRCVVDVLAIAPTGHAAIALDWKTGGKVQPEFEQLGLTAQVLFAHYPKLEVVSGVYVWLGHDTHSQKTYTRDGMAPFWNDIYPMVDTMAEAHKTMTYPPQPSGLCKHYCPVASCPYHGKGSH
jgi:hypothetical protein